MFPSHEVFPSHDRSNDGELVAQSGRRMQVVTIDRDGNFWLSVTQHWSQRAILVYRGRRTILSTADTRVLRFMITRFEYTDMLDMFVDDREFTEEEQTYYQRIWEQAFNVENVMKSMLSD